ncbi:MAG: response regulator transcription factor [Thermoflavifilum sp.]|nr:response regulator transcription factor [Thermoflavifilum sp.]
MKAINTGKILIVDDEPDILAIISYNLRNAGYETFVASNGDEAIEKARIYHPHLIILDIMMPGKNGMEVCRELKAQPAFQDTMILFLTALNDDAHEIEGLNLGADDYVVKPIKPNLLISRVHALFRRMKKLDEPILQIGDLLIDSEKFQVVYQGKPIILAKKEFELLKLLASRPGRVFMRHEILDQVWGADVIVGDRTIDVHIRKIRQKLGADLIATVKGVGYKFEG